MSSQYIYEKVEKIQDSLMPTHECEHESTVCQGHVRMTVQYQQKRSQVQSFPKPNCDSMCIVK